MFRPMIALAAGLALLGSSQASPDRRVSLHEALRRADEVRIYVRDVRRSLDWPERSSAVLSPRSNARWFRELKALKPRREPGHRGIACVRLVFAAKGEALAEAGYTPKPPRFGTRDTWWHVSPDLAAWIARLEPAAEPGR